MAKLNDIYKSVFEKITVKIQGVNIQEKETVLNVRKRKYVHNAWVNGILV